MASTPEPTAVVVELPPSDSHEQYSEEFEKLSFLLLEGENLELVQRNTLWKSIKSWNVLAMVLASLVIICFGAMSAALVANVIVSVILAISIFIAFVWVILAAIQSYLGSEYFIVTNFRVMRVVLRGICRSKAEVKYLPLVLIREISILNAHSFRAQYARRTEQAPKLTGTPPAMAFADMQKSHRSVIESYLLQNDHAHIHWVQNPSRWEIALSAMRGPAFACAFLFPAILLPVSFMLKDDLVSMLTAAFGMTASIFAVATAMGLLFWRQIFTPSVVVLTRQCLIQSECNALFASCREPIAEAKPLKKCFPVELLDWQVPPTSCGGKTSRCSASGSGYVAVNAADAWPSPKSRIEREILAKYNVDGEEYIADAVINIKSCRTDDMATLNAVLWEAFVENWRQNLQLNLNKKGDDEMMYDIDL